MPAWLRASFHTWRWQFLHTPVTSALKAFSVSATPTSQPSCSVWSLAFSACSLALSASFSFFLRAMICHLEAASWSSAWRQNTHWPSACLSTLSKAALALFFIPFYLGHFTLHLVYSFFGHIEGLQGGVAPSFFFFHLLVAVIGYLIYLKGGLNSLSRKETQIIKKKKIKRGKQ